MQKWSFFQVDAFTHQPLHGNACAVIFDTDGLDDEQMLAIAREFNLSETAFVSKPTHSNAAFRVRYFTPRTEIPLAGHPTIATAHALCESGRWTYTPHNPDLMLELQAGVIKVVFTELNPMTFHMDMYQKKPMFGRQYLPEKILPAFGLAHEDLFPGAIIQTVSTGTPQLMVFLKDKQSLNKATLMIHAYKACQQMGDFFSAHLFCLEEEPTHLGPRTIARHFDLPPDILEDPFTGSATGGMAAYLWHYGYLQQPSFSAEQGHLLHRPGEASVSVLGSRDSIETVKVGGRAVTVMKGELFF